MESELITIVGTILGSSLLTIGVLLRQMNHLETKLETRITGLDTKFDTKIDALDTKVTDRIDRLDTKFSKKIDALDTKFTDRIDALDTKFTKKLDVMGRDVADTRERVARVEGYLMAPEGFTLRTPPPPSTADAPPEDPGTARRQAG